MVGMTESEFAKEKYLIRKEMKRLAKPLLDVHCITEEGCKYPVALKVTMDDGTVQTYDYHCDVQPNFKEAMDALDRMFNCITITGYQYVPPEQRRRKNRIHRCER